MAFVLPAITAAPVCFLFDLPLRCLGASMNASSSSSSSSSSFSLSTNTTGAGNFDFGAVCEDPPAFFISARDDDEVLTAFRAGSGRVQATSKRSSSLSSSSSESLRLWCCSLCNGFRGGGTGESCVKSIIVNARSCRSSAELSFLTRSSQGNKQGKWKKVG